MSQEEPKEVVKTKDDKKTKEHIHQHDHKISSPTKTSSSLATKMSNQIDRMQHFREVRKMVDRRHTHHGVIDFADKRGLAKVSTRSNDFAYVNPGYTGSVNSVNTGVAAPTSVVREQYWACSRWPLAQRALALMVGILLGAVIGLAATVAYRGGHRNHSIERDSTGLT